MSLTRKIEDKLRDAFAPAELSVRDDSEAHRGHGGYREGGETHFHVTLRADALNGMSRVAQQRAIHAVLKEELEGRVHALALDVGGTEG